MDFRGTKALLEQGLVEEDTVIRNIIDLPCLYAIFREEDEILCMDTEYKLDSEIYRILPVFSNLDLATEAKKQFPGTEVHNIGYWDNFLHGMSYCLEVEDMDYVGLDVMVDVETSELVGLLMGKSMLETIIDKYIEEHDD